MGAEQAGRDFLRALNPTELASQTVKLGEDAIEPHAGAGFQVDERFVYPTIGRDGSKLHATRRTGLRHLRPPSRRR